MFYNKSKNEVLQTLASNEKLGLSKEESLERLDKYGKNVLESSEKKSMIKAFLYQFKDFMIYILIAAAIISGFLGEITDAIIIILVILLNAIIGVIQESKAEQSLEALKEYQEFLPEELASMDQFNMPKYPISAIIQYRPAGQATSFSEDAKSYSESFRLLNEDTVAVIEEYAATVSDFDARIAGFTYNDPYAPINNGGNGGGNSGNNNGGSSNKPDNTADALTAFLAVTAIVSAGCVVALVRAKRSYNR